MVFLLAALGFLHAVVSFTPLLGWWARALAGPWDDPPGQVLIVPGAEANADTIGISSYWRSIYAVRLWREGGVRHIVVSGGGGIAERMKEFMVGSGVPESAVLVEGRSTSTRENALFTKPMVDSLSGRMVLMTSDYHCRRATAVFRKAGIDVAPRPIPDALKRYHRWTERWPVFVSLAVETVKLVYYRWNGWM